MKYLAQYGGCALIGAITQMVGCGWFYKNGGISPSGAFINILACITWIGIIHLLSKKEST